MELTNLKQLDLEDIAHGEINCMVATIGQQPRCYFLAEKLHHAVSRKILLVPPEIDPKAGKFLPVFEKFGFVNRTTANHEFENILPVLNEICKVSGGKINVLIDYSCMPKKWYAAFIDGITRNNYPVEEVNFYLSYTPKVFDKKPGKQSIDYFGPIIRKRDNLNEKKPVSMIVALDNNHNTVIEAVNKVKPQKLLAFIPNCSHDPEYSKLVEENNKSLLGKLNPQNIIRYECDRPEQINSLLTSCCLDERIDSEVVILPQGPKTFSMMSMLLSVRYPDVKLWEIILKDLKINSEHGHPAANPVIVKVSFINDELD
ncbi:MAG TPA: hypothetical protein VK179_14510 [Bacteroidales bacterium]|nr:hypothetical protein [Bacteroidales bacterium]